MHKGRKMKVKGRCSPAKTLFLDGTWLRELTTAKVKTKKPWTRKLVQVFCFSVRLGKDKAVYLTTQAESYRKWAWPSGFFGFTAEITMKRREEKYMLGKDKTKSPGHCSQGQHRRTRNRG